MGAEDNGYSSQLRSNHPKITVSFGVSTSRNYNIAVERAMKYSTYQETGEGKNVIHSVTFSFDEISDLMSMLDLVGQWKSTALYVDNKMVSYSEISGVLYCYSERQRAYNPDEYCHGKDDATSYNDNDLGCRHCGVNLYGWDGLSEFGQMQKDGTFIVDKDKLIFTVARNLENYMLCPALNIQKIKNKLKAFPDAINPKTNRQWEYVKEWHGNKEVAVSVRKKDPKRISGYVIKDNNFEKQGSKQSAIAGSGCLLPILMTILILIIGIYMF